MLGQIQHMQQQLRQAQARLTEEIVVGTAGGGAVRVTMTGDQRCRSIEISADLLKDGDADILQDLVLAAVNLALEQSRALASERLGPIAGGLQL